MEQNSWALKEFNIDATKDIETFLEEVETSQDFQSFIEIMKRIQDSNFYSFLYSLIPVAESHAHGFEFIFTKIDTIFDLKRAYEAFGHLVYYLVDDECLTLVEIDYDYAFSFRSDTIEEKRITGNEKLYALCTGLWNTSRSPYDFFYSYLDKEAKHRSIAGSYDMFEISKVNKVRYHNFNTLDGVQDFTSFITFLYDKYQKMVDEYNKEKKEYRESGKNHFYIKPSYFERCENILSSYLDSTTTEEATKYDK